MNVETVVVPEKFYVIRARASKATGGLVYWMQTPYEEYGVKYHWATHPGDATCFADKEMAEKFASFQPKHCEAEAVRMDIALDTHDMPPDRFPFNVFCIPSDAELVEEEVA